MEKGLNHCDLEPIHLIPLLQNGMGSVIVFRVVVVEEEQEEKEGAGRGRIVQYSEDLEGVASIGMDPADLFEPSPSGSDGSWIKYMEKLRALESKQPSSVLCCTKRDEVLEGGDFGKFEANGEAWWHGRYGEEDQVTFLNACETMSDMIDRSESGMFVLKHNRVQVFVRGFLARHVDGWLYVLELEEQVNDANHNGYRSLLGLVEREMNDLLLANEFAHIFEACVKHVYNVTGFDRVMFYLFLEDGAGEVVAEATSQKESTYLGLRYPAKDIPKQARALFARNKIRVIRCAWDKQVVKMVPTCVDGALVDLSDVRFRSPSPIHKKYLCNMGVTSSTQASIFVDGKLFGLISCLSYQGVKQLSPEAFLHLTIVSSMCEARIQGLLRSKRENILGEITRLVEPLEEAQEKGALKNAGGNAAVVLKTIGEGLCQVFSVDAVIVVPFSKTNGERVAGKCVILGNRSIREDLVREMAVQLQSKMAPALIPHTDCFENVDNAFWHDVYVPEKREDEMLVCGLAVISSPSVDLLLCRGEHRHEVKWAGKVAASIRRLETSAENQLTPRNSFAMYIEQVENTSKPWNEHELKGMEFLRMRLLAWLDKSERINASAKRFLESMGQEISLPFNGILGMLTAIAGDETLDEHVRSKVDVVNRSAQGMLEILEGALMGNSTDEKRESFGGSFHFKTFDPFQLLRDMTNMFSIRAKQVGIKIASEQATFFGGENGSQVLYKGDTARIRSLFSNLMNTLFQRLEPQHGKILIRMLLSDSMLHILNEIQDSLERYETPTHNFDQVQTMIMENMGNSIPEELNPLNWCLVTIISTPTCVDPPGKAAMSLCDSMGGGIWCMNSTKGRRKGTVYQFAIPIGVEAIEPERVNSSSSSSSGPRKRKLEMGAQMQEQSSSGDASVSYFSPSSSSSSSRFRVSTDADGDASSVSYVSSHAAKSIVLSPPVALMPSRFFCVVMCARDAMDHFQGHLNRAQIHTRKSFTIVFVHDPKHLLEEFARIQDKTRLVLIQDNTTEVAIEVRKFSQEVQIYLTPTKQPSLEMRRDINFKHLTGFLTLPLQSDHLYTIVNNSFG